MYRFHVGQWFLVACWLGLQGAVGPKAESLTTEKPLAPQSKAQAESLNPLSFHLKTFNRPTWATPRYANTELRSKIVVETDAQTRGRGDAEKMNMLRMNATWYKNFQPSTFNPQPSKTLLTKSISCPSDLETLIPLLLRDLPGYATRVMRRSRRPTNTTENPIYFVLAGRPEFEPLTLGPGQYSTPTPTTDLEPPKQVFFTTLERQYRDGKPSYRQLYHWLFLTQTTEGWRLAMMFSRIGSAAAGRPPTPPEESSEGVVGQAVKTWLRDCRAGAIRESRNRVEGAGEAGGTQRQE